jgi:4-amino-4-deoxy-L-arabinose transferase-like glycosyltransferase
LGLLLWARSEARPWLGLPAGVVLGAAYLTRPEGFLVFTVCALGVVAALRKREGRGPSPALRFTTVMLGFAVISLPFWVHLKQHTGHFALTGKAERNLAIASAKAADVPYHQLRLLNEEATEIVYSPTASTRTAIANRFALNLRRLGGMLADMASLFLVACLGLALAAVLRCPPSRKAAIYVVVLVAVVLLLTPSVFFLEYRMLLAPLALLLLLAAGALSEPDGARARGVSSQTKVAAWLLALAMLQLTVGSALLIADPIGEPMADITPLLTAVQREPGATGPVLGNSREPRALAFATGRDFFDLPWESLPRVLQFAHHQRAAFLLVSEDDHPDLARLASHAVTTQELRPLARLETGSGKERRALQLYLIAPTQPSESAP